MYIAGLQKTSLIDYPTKISTVIFTGGCNFYCPFCHNPELVDPKLKLPPIPEKDFFKFIRKRKKILDAVVITGGEPTLDADLTDFIKRIKQMGYLVKLDTNGSNPSHLSFLISHHLIDYLAMDIKGPLDEYEKITGVKINQKNIRESINLIKKSGLDYEFRTTVVPGLHKDKDFEKMGKILKGSKKFVLQQFRPLKTLDPKYQNIAPYPEEKLHQFAKIMRKYVKEVGIRGI